MKNRKLQQRNGISRKHKIQEEPNEKYNKKLKVERLNSKKKQKKNQKIERTVKVTLFEKYQGNKQKKIK